MTHDDLARFVTEARFRPVRLRTGYAIDEVDALLDRLVAMIGESGGVRAVVEAARFTPVRFREAYDMEDVDDFLAEVVDRAETAER